MNRWQPILAVLEEFSRHLAPDVPALVIEHANDRTWSQARYRQHRKDTGYWRKRGCHAFIAQREACGLQVSGAACTSLEFRMLRPGGTKAWHPLLHGHHRRGRAV